MTQEANSGDQFHYDGLPLPIFRPANEILRPDYSDPQKPVFPSISELVANLTPEDVQELIALYDISNALQTYFQVETSSEGVSYFVLARDRIQQDGDLGGGVFASDFGIYSDMYPREIKTGTVTELRVLLSDNSISVGEFVRTLPVETIFKEDTPNGSSPEAERDLREHIQKAMSDTITEEDIDAIGYEILKDYKNAAFNLVDMLAFSKNSRIAFEMLRKAEALAKAGGFELNYATVAKSFADFHELSYGKNLAALDEYFESRRPFDFPTFRQDGTTLMLAYLTDALESAELLGKDTSFVGKYFDALFPQILEILKQDFKELRLQEASGKDILQSAGRYTHNRLQLIKLAKAAGKHEEVNRFLDKMETTVPLSFN